MGALKTFGLPDYAYGYINFMGFCSDGTVRKVLVSSYKPYIHYYSSISTRLPEILDCSFQSGLRTSNFGEGLAAGGRGWYRSKVKCLGEFL